MNADIMNKLTIVKATVLIGHGADRVNLHTTSPCSFVPECIPEQPRLVVQFEATRGTGAEYVRKHFGIEPQVVEI